MNQTITNNNFMKKISLLVALLFVGASLFAQKINVTNAHNAFKNYVPIVGDLETNKKALKEAKEAIDLAAVNSETDSALDMHRYRGMIYYSLIETATIEAGISGSQPNENSINEFESKMKLSFDFILNAPNNIKKAKSEKEEVLNFVNAKSKFVFDNGLSMYNAKNYEQATQLFIGAYEISKYINVENVDAKSNAILCFRKSADTLMSLKKYDEANKLGEIVMEFTPNNIEVIISLINVNLQKNDLAATEKYLNIATSIDSTNKQLFLVLGTSLMDMKQQERAAAAFLKALNIDPLYPDAIYQYCSLLFNWSIELRGNASDLKINDPKAKAMEEQALNNLNTSIKYLEPFLIANPNDKTALEIGWRTYSYLDQTDKSAELKKRWEAIK
jgi:tetratricopeptide (TPR) repeat protein